MAIFLMSIVVIGQLVTMGGERALDIDQQGEATLLCQAKLAEVVAGVQPLTSQSDQAFDEAPDFKWSIDAEQGAVSNLWNVTVHVTRERSDGSKVECTLSQMILDPSQRGSSQDTVSISGTPSSGGGQRGSSSSPSSPSQSSPSPAAGAAQSKTTTPSAAPKTKTTTTPSAAPKTTTTPSTAPKTTTPSTAPKTTTPSTTKGGR